MWRRCLGKKREIERVQWDIGKRLLATWQRDTCKEQEHMGFQHSVGRVGTLLCRDAFGSQFVSIPMQSFTKMVVRPLSVQPPKQANMEKKGEGSTFPQHESKPVGNSALGTMDTRAWFWKEISQLPNALSLSRMCAGPVVAYWIASSQWHLAVIGLSVAGATDWLDGYIAKKQGQQSVLGSYLDPFADKILIACAVGALVYRGYLPTWVACTVIARDIFLVAATLMHRSRHADGLGWQLFEHIRQGKDSDLVQPFLISKVNTAVQLILVSSCMAQGWLGWPGEGNILVLSQITVGTTILSWVAYVHAYFAGSKPIP